MQANKQYYQYEDSYNYPEPNYSSISQHKNNSNLDIQAINPAIEENQSYDSYKYMNNRASESTPVNVSDPVVILKNGMSVDQIKQITDARLHGARVVFESYESKKVLSQTIYDDTHIYSKSANPILNVSSSLSHSNGISRSTMKDTRDLSSSIPDNDQYSLPYSNYDQNVNTHSYGRRISAYSNVTSASSTPVSSINNINTNMNNNNNNKKKMSNNNNINNNNINNNNNNNNNRNSNNDYYTNLHYDYEYRNAHSSEPLFTSHIKRNSSQSGNTNNNSKNNNSVMYSSLKNSTMNINNVKSSYSSHSIKNNNSLSTINSHTLNNNMNNNNTNNNNNNNNNNNYLSNTIYFDISNSPQPDVYMTQEEPPSYKASQLTYNKFNYHDDSEKNDIDYNNDYNTYSNERYEYIGNGPLPYSFDRKDLRVKHRESEPLIDENEQDYENTYYNTNIMPSMQQQMYRNMNYINKDEYEYKNTSNNH